MKRLFTILAVVLLTATMWAQSPQKISYQAVIRDATNHLVTTQVAMRITILLGPLTPGTAVYVERQITTPNANGLVMIQINGPTVTHDFGTFADIDWSAGEYHIKTETDINPGDGSNYTITGTSQLLSVPYALHAKTVSNYSETDPKIGLITSGYSPKWDGSNLITGAVYQNTSGNVGIGTTDVTSPYSSSTKLFVNGGLVVHPQGGSDRVAFVPQSNLNPGYASFLVISPTTLALTSGESLAKIQIQNASSTIPSLWIVNQGSGDILGLGNSNSYSSSSFVVKNSGSVGIGTSNPNSSAILDLESTIKGFLPPRITQTQRDAITPTEGLIVYNTTTKIPNYYDGTVWRNYDGTLAKIPEIGDPYRGGIIAYILQSGDPGYIEGEIHGIIAAPSDQSIGTIWGCYGTTISGADGTSLGTGNQNTIDIVIGCTTAGIAAKLCYDFTLNGYSDWYLPSKDELNKLYINKASIGGFANDNYWSSSEYNGSDVWIQWFANGLQRNDWNKSLTGYVRAIRAF